jgi:hypothetical protein
MPDGDLSVFNILRPRSAVKENPHNEEEFAIPVYFHPNELKDLLNYLESHSNTYYVLL